MGDIYRRIKVAMWADDKFLRLSRPKPNAQSLWVYLLAGPDTSQIPGLIVAGEAGLAESLDWPIGAFRRCWKEITGQRMVRADWKNRVIWVPKAIQHNAPANPNVVRSWREPWDLVPDCTLKSDAWIALRTFFTGFDNPEPWVAAFEGACRKPSSKPSPKASEESSPKPLSKGSPKQEQEQEQDKDTSAIDPACIQMAEFLKAAILRNTPDARVPNSLAKWANVFRLIRDRDKRDFVQVKAVIEWATAHDFWRPNIMSADKLRAKYDTLKGQMERDGNRSRHPAQATGENGFVC